MMIAAIALDSGFYHITGLDSIPMLNLKDSTSFYDTLIGTSHSPSALFDDTAVLGMLYRNTLVKQAVTDSFTPSFVNASQFYTALEFDFVPQYNSIAFFQIVYLGITNWPGPACSNQDKFINSAIISGPGYPRPYNIARVSGTDVHISSNAFPLYITYEGYPEDGPL